MQPVNLTRIAKRRLRQVIPAGLGWDQSNWPLTIDLIENNIGRRPIFAPSLDVTSLASYLACLTGPTIYAKANSAAPAGSGTSGDPYRSIWSAIAAANSGGVPCNIVCEKNGSEIFTKDRNFTQGVVTNVPTVDIRFVAKGGRIVSSTQDTNITSWSVDGTFGYTYKPNTTIGDVARVLDIGQRDHLGLHPDLVQVSTAQQCQDTPGSWALVSTTLYVHRADCQPVTNQNTRVLRRTANFAVSGATQRNLFLTGEFAGDGFDLEGGALTGGARGVVNIGYSASSVTKKIFYAKGCSFRYGGIWGGNSDSSNGISGNNMSGLIYLDLCDASGNKNDGINIHDTNAYGLDVLTVHCTGFGNGIIGGTSCNGWTLHEAVRGIDVGGWYEGNGGGNVHLIDDSMAALYGTVCRRSRGDRILFATNSYEPFEVRADDNAEMWLYGTRPEPLHSAAWAHVATGAAIIRKNGVWRSHGHDLKTGTAQILEEAA